jgi:hypothetical protein
VDFPGSGSAKQAALLLLDQLSSEIPAPDGTVVIGGHAVPAFLVSWARVDTVLGELASRHQAAWKDSYSGSPDILRAEVVELLSALRLAQPTDSGLAVFPFAARYQPKVTVHPTARPTEGDES